MQKGGIHLASDLYFLFSKRNEKMDITLYSIHGVVPMTAWIDSRSTHLSGSPYIIPRGIMVV
jgi:hypothetical protein